MRVKITLINPGGGGKKNREKVLWSENTTCFARSSGEKRRRKKVTSTLRLKTEGLVGVEARLVGLRGESSEIVLIPKDWRGNEIQFVKENQRGGRNL